MAFMQFLFDWPPLLAIFIISFVITLVITIVYKYTTDQKRMRELKEKVKVYQDKMKTMRDNPEKLLKVQQEAMKYNFELMKHSLRPTLYTFIPVILVFAWLNAHMAYYNIAPQQDFTIAMTSADGVSGNASLSLIPVSGLALLDNGTKEVRATDKGPGTAMWRLKGDAGLYKASISYAGATVEKSLRISSVRGDYEAPMQAYKGGVAKVEVSNEAIHPFGTFSLFGWQPGWLATYILLSILLSIVVRKALNVV